MREWYSERFGCIVRLTQHAFERMQERKISYNLIGELIEVGTIRRKDKHRMWIYQKCSERDDNLICAAVVIEDKLIIKTIMHHWQLLMVEALEYEN